MRTWLEARVSALAAATEAPPARVGLGTAALASEEAAMGFTLTPLEGSARIAVLPRPHILILQLAM